MMHSRNTFGQNYTADKDRLRQSILLHVPSYRIMAMNCTALHIHSAQRQMSMPCNTPIFSPIMTALYALYISIM